MEKFRWQRLEKVILKYSVRSQIHVDDIIREIKSIETNANLERNQAWCVHHINLPIICIFTISCWSCIHDTFATPINCVLHVCLSTCYIVPCYVELYLITWSIWSHTKTDSCASENYNYLWSPKFFIICLCSLLPILLYSIIVASSSSMPSVCAIQASCNFVQLIKCFLFKWNAVTLPSNSIGKICNNL